MKNLVTVFLGWITIVLPLTSHAQTTETYDLNWERVVKINGKVSKLVDAPTLSRQVSGKLQNGVLTIHLLMETSIDGAWSGERSQYRVTRLARGELTQMCIQMGFRRGFVSYNPKEIVLDRKGWGTEEGIWYAYEKPWYRSSREQDRMTYHQVNALRCLL